jgi:hypothetical protein
MNILGVQLVLIAFGLFMIYVLFLHWKKKNISNKFFGMWMAVWLMYEYFSIFPQQLQPLLKELFIVRVMDLGMIVAFMILGYVTVENNIKIRNQDKIIEKMVRSLAVKNK